MALLKDTLIQGSARVTDTLYANTMQGSLLKTDDLQSPLISLYTTINNASNTSQSINLYTNNTLRGHIGISDSSLGIYSTGKILLRPGAGGFATDRGIEITTTAVNPYSTAGSGSAVALGSTSLRWNGVYSSTGNFSGTVTADRLSTNIFLDFRRTDGPSYIMMPDGKDLIINNGSSNGTAYADLQIGKTGITNAYGGSLGSSTYPWGSLYSQGPSYIYSGNSQWCLDTYIYNKSKNQVAEIYYNSGNADNVTTGQFSFRQFSPKATPDTAPSGFHETFQLPSVTAARTDNGIYSIITTKNLSIITTVGTISSGTWNGSKIGVAYGGTGATTFTSDCVVVGNGTNAMESRGLKVTGATDASVTVQTNTSGKTLFINSPGGAADIAIDTAANSGTGLLYLSSGNTLYINKPTNASIIFTSGGTDVNHEKGRFNIQGMFQLNSNVTQSTHKLLVNGDSAFTGKIAFIDTPAATLTEKVYIQQANNTIQLVAKAINSPTITGGTGITASDLGANANPRYRPASWKYNAGITPVDGDIVTIKIPSAAHDYGTWLSLDNGSTYHPIIHSNGSRLQNWFSNNMSITLRYDSAATCSMFGAQSGTGIIASNARATITGCWRLITQYDTGNPGDWNLRQYTIKAASTITSGHIIGGTDNGYSDIDSGTAFDIRYAVLYAGNSIATGSTGTNNFIHHYSVNIKNSSGGNISLTTYKNVYIKGTISGHLFTPITGGSPYVSDITAADDGYAYYYIGRCYSSNNAFTFDATGKSIFWYKNGAIRQYGDYGISFVAYGGTLATNGWKTLHGRTNGPHISVAYNNASKDWNTSAYSATLTWGGIGDTHGLIDCCYNSPIVSFGGSSTGNSTDNDPKWYFKLIGTSAQSYTFPTTSKTLAATDGSNASGTWGISISGNATNVTGTVTYQHGGTGLTTLGSAGQVLKVNSSANGIEWGTVSTADEKVKVAANITTAADYPVVFANSNKSTTAAETAGLNKSGTKFYFNPSTGLLTATQVANAIWNDYAEYRKQLYTIQPGYVIKDTDSGYVVKANERLIPGAQIVSDTWGHSMGKTDECQTPVAVAGRVLAYTYRPRGQYHAGMAVCSAPGGTIDIMTREEIRDYPDAIIGIVSEIPDYEEWGSGKVKVDGRIWIKVR